MPSNSEALRVTTAVTVGALLLLGFGYYRYSISNRRRKRKDEEISESSIEVKSQSLLSTSPSNLDDSPSKTSNISISITKKENGHVVNDFEKKEEARRVIQKVLSESMIKNGVSDNSKKILEETLDGLHDNGSIKSTLSHDVSSEKLPESSRYVSFEEVLKRKSMEPSPTPPQTRYSPSSLHSGSPSKNYVHLSRESSFVKEERVFSPQKGKDSSPSFELFNSKRSSIEKEVTEVITSNVNLSPRQSPEKFKTFQSNLESIPSNNEFNTTSSLEISAPKANNSHSIAPENSSLNQIHGEEETTKPNLPTSNAQIPGEPEVETSSKSFSKEVPEDTFQASSYIVTNSVEAKNDSDAASVSNSQTFGVPDVPSESFSKETASIQVKNDEKSTSTISDLQKLVEPEKGSTSVSPYESVSIETPVDVEPISNGPSSFEIINLEPKMLQDEKEPSSNFEKFVRKTSNDSNQGVPSEKNEEGKEDVIPPLETLPTSTSVSTSKSDDKKDSLSSFSTNFRPGWAKNSKVNGSNGHAWEKGVAVSEKKSIPKANSGEEDDDMSLLSKSQEKGLHSKALLLSDSDEEEGKSPEEPIQLSKPLVMEDIREESEEPKEEDATSSNTIKNTKKQEKSRKKNRKK